MNDIASSAYLRRVVHAICLGGASTLALSALAPPTNAEAADAADTNANANASDADLKEIVVTGLRASLQNSVLPAHRPSIGLRRRYRRKTLPASDYPNPH